VRWVRVVYIHCFQWGSCWFYSLAWAHITAEKGAECLKYHDTQGSNSVVPTHLQPWFSFNSNNDVCLRQPSLKSHLFQQLLDTQNKNRTTDIERK
jgi:hypothetical protein